MKQQYQQWAALALLGLNVITSFAAGDCVPACVNEVIQNRFKDFGCKQPSDFDCMCPSAAFVDSVAECSVGKCKASAAEIEAGLTDQGTPPNPPRFCVTYAGRLPAIKGAPPGTSASTPSPSPSSTVSSTPSSTSQPSTSATPTSTTSASSTVTTSASTSSSGTTTTSHPATTSSATGESSPTSSPVPASGISSGAAAGIGIGVAIVVVAVAVIAFCLLRKRKGQAAPRHSMDISKPLPGSGRTYPAREDRDRDRDSYDKYGNDIEMTANRYEDMVPSQQPRTMV